jgi:hypothetical protein
MKSGLKRPKDKIETTSPSEQLKKQTKGYGSGGF